MNSDKFNPKHIIISRKGFDSAAGGNASMIIDQDNSTIIQPLPIPDKNTEICYAHVDSGLNHSLADLMKMASITPRLNGEEVETCHLDPDIFYGTKYGAFGQIDAAESHLKSNGVGAGDLFIFFGWYKRYSIENNTLVRQKDKSGDDRHVLYGYLFVDKVFDLTRNEELDAVPEEYRNHPHYKRQQDDEASIKHNRLYIAKDYIPGTKVPGFGIFYFKEDLILSADGMSKSKWNIGQGNFINMFKNKKITYHSENSWKDNYFQSVSRGQEFIIDLDGDDKIRDEILDFIKEHILLM